MRVSLIVVLVFVAGRCGAEEASPDKPVGATQKNWTEDLRQSAELFTVYASLGAEQPVRMVPAYAWSNPARPALLGDRPCLLYVHDGRPVASCKIYPTGSSIVHTFISFTDLPLVAKQGDTVIWSPPQSAPVFVRLSEAKPPHQAASYRRIQMKALAREFAAETGPGEAKRQASVPELRLLPKALYRYEVDDDGQDGLVDGAVFCFVANGGNPQVLLLLEAVREGESMYWRYGFSRRTFAQLKVFHGKREVWTAKYFPGSKMKSTSTFYRLALPLPAEDTTGPSGLR